MASAAGGQYQIVLVEDAQHRRWVIRAPLSPVAGARMDSTGALLRLLARRLPFSMPVPHGYVPLGEVGRAAVYPFLPGRPLRWSRLPARSALAADVGHTIAALHNVDRALYDEAGVPAYDAETYRTRRLAELDRAAATGHVPNGLLSRWERALEDVSLWRFAPTPLHGDLTGAHVLGAFEDDQDAASGRVKGVTGWEGAKVADPADDFAALAVSADPGALDTVLEAYAHARVERPDPHLELRARLAGELRQVSALLAATAVNDSDLVLARSAALRRLDEQTRDRRDLVPGAGAAVSSGHRVRADAPDAAGGPQVDPEVGARSAGGTGGAGPDHESGDPATSGGATDGPAPDHESGDPVPRAFGSAPGDASGGEASGDDSALAAAPGDDSALAAAPGEDPRVVDAPGEDSCLEAPADDSAVAKSLDARGDDPDDPNERGDRASGHDRKGESEQEATREIPEVQPRDNFA